MGATFVISRLDLRHILVTFGVSEKKIDEFESALSKSHRHVNAVTLSNMLLSMGLRQDEIKNILRRIGIDDITTTNILNALDEDKISSTYGRVIELTIS
ncbi:MAG: hypothetical protein QXG73_01120 [Candidatus Micrarchaeaceae archaeon]